MRKIRQLINILAIIADTGVHSRHHIHADFHNIRRTTGVRQQWFDLVCCRRNLDHCRIHTGIFFKFQHYHTVIFRTGTGYFFDAVNSTKRTLHRLCNTLLHLLRAGSRIRRNNHHIRHTHIWQKICFHARKADKPDYQNNDDRNQYRKRLFYTVFNHRNLHVHIVLC